jgi:hypothetical protein
VIITRIEEGLEDKESAGRTLKVLEDLLTMPHTTVILISGADPEALALELNPEKNDLARWLRVLNSFAKESLYQSLESNLPPAKCQLLWRSCSSREKLALWQLAKFGLPNRRNDEALDRLIQRGLVIHKETGFHISGPTFADFVGSDLPAMEVAVLFPPDVDNAWRGLRWVLIYSFVLLLGVAVFSVVELLGSPAAGLFTLGTTAIPLLKVAFDLLPLGAKSRSSA